MRVEAARREVASKTPKVKTLHMDVAAAVGTKLREQREAGESWERWSLNRLTPFPDHEQALDDLPAADLTRLMDDIAKQGQIDPIEVLPNGTILHGHQRHRALRELGLSTALVYVRHDLVDDRVGAHLRFLQANDARRHLGPLDRLRCIEAQLRLEGSADELSVEMKEQLAAAFKVTLRTINRFVQVLRLPRELQRAAACGRLQLGIAARLEGLTEPELARLAAAADDDDVDFGKLVKAALTKRQKARTFDIRSGLGRILGELRGFRARDAAAVDGAVVQRLAAEIKAAADQIATQFNQPPSSKGKPLQRRLARKNGKSSAVGAA